jgi:hypothetical protein
VKNRAANSARLDTLYNNLAEFVGLHSTWRDTRVMTEKNEISTRKVEAKDMVPKIGRASDD